MSVGKTDRQAPHGAAARRCAAEPTPSPPSLRGKWNKGEVASRLMSCDQNATTFVSNVVASCSGTKAHAEHVLTGCANIHDEEVIDCLHAEALSIELSKVDAIPRKRCVVFSICLAGCEDVLQGN